MIETRFTRLFDLRAPIQLAGMPGIGTPELVLAVATAGGLGMISGLESPSELEATLDALSKSTSGAFGVNFLIPFLDPDCVTMAARGARLVEFFYGEPDAKLIAEVHRQGALSSWQVGSVAEAIAAREAGCDLVIAQGTEAGGHVRGTSSLFPLLSEVLDVLEIPVLAAGGIATGRDLAAALACGASGVRVGTRFVAAAESGAHPSYIDRLIASSASDTCLTQTFSVMWPDAPHRVLRSAIEAATAATEDIVGRARVGGQLVPAPRFAVMAPTRDATGQVEAMALYAGESVGHVRRIQPAAEILVELVSEAEKRQSRPTIVPEFYVSDLEASLAFYVDLLGFRIEYERPDDRFVALSIGSFVGGNGFGQPMLMLEQAPALAKASREAFQGGQWRTADLEPPFGRGVNLEVEVAEFAAVSQRIEAKGHPLLLPLHERSYHVGSGHRHVEQLLVADPDGYLIRLSRPLHHDPKNDPSDDPEEGTTA